jgi:hypothetical protein
MYKRNLSDMPQNIKHVLTHVLLANCSQRTFVSLQECAYKVCNLPMVLKSFNDVTVVGCYNRALLLHRQQSSSMGDSHLVYTDRTKYSAYAERCNDNTKVTGFSKQAVELMSLREFAEQCNAKFIMSANVTLVDIDKKKKKRLKCVEEGSGHWKITRRKTRDHVRFSTILYTDLAANYEPIDVQSTSTPISFMELPIDKRRQLARNNYELVVYEPWQVHPDETFLTAETRAELKNNDSEFDYRYSFKR